jgi:hypothetical protein
MTDSHQLRGSRLPSQDVESLIELKGVTAHDFGLQIMSDPDGKIGFAGRGRAGEHYVSQLVHLMQKTRALWENAGQVVAKTLIRSGCPLHIWSFSAAHDQLAAEKLFIVKFLNRTSSFLDGRHLNEGKAFGTLCILMTDDLSILNLAYPIEELKKVALRGVKRQVAHVELGGGDLH